MADEKQEWTITFNSNEIRAGYPDCDLTDNEAAEIAQSLIDMFNECFFDWIRA